MRVVLTERLIIDRPAEDVWAHVLDPTNLTDFTGYGPIPGIARASCDGAVGVGMRRAIENADGSTHREEVVVFEPLRRIVDRIDGFDSPVRFLAREILDDFRFARSNGGTEIVRTFTVELRTPLVWPLAVVMRAFMSRAIAAHLANVKERLEAG